MLNRSLMARARVLVADPPWSFSDRLPGKGRGAVKHYPCLSVDALCEFRLPPMEHNSFLFLWRVASMQQEALTVMKAWGFTLKTELVWEKLTVTGKPHFGMGHYFRAAHETCLVGVRGAPKPKVRNLRSRFSACTGARHSEKPEEFFGILERFSDGPYVELFARRRRAGWSCFGNELEEAA